jgi:flagellar biosynthesis/type III secretory pathway protein FliH
MCLEEYNRELHYRTLRREGYEDGFEDGRDEGLNKGRTEGQIKGEARVSLLCQKLLSDKRMDDLQRSCTDKDFRRKLFEEYGL